MAAVIRCPSCGRLLRLPGELAGQAVKCPSCGKGFTAETGAEEPPPAPAARAPEYSPAAAPLPQAPPSEDPVGEEGEDYRIGPERRDSFAEARSAVAGPATALIMLGALALSLSALDVMR